MTSRTGSNGFTLIEVLVASVILFAGLGAVLKAYSMAVAALDAATDVTVSSVWLHGQAAAIELQVKTGEQVMPGNGRIVEGGREYLWEVETRDRPVTPDITVKSAGLRIVRAPAGVPHMLQAEWAVFREPSKPEKRGTSGF